MPKKETERFVRIVTKEKKRSKEDSFMDDATEHLDEALFNGNMAFCSPAFDDEHDEPLCVIAVHKDWFSKILGFHPEFIETIESILKFDKNLCLEFEESELYQSFKKFCKDNDLDVTKYEDAIKAAQFINDQLDIKGISIEELNDAAISAAEQARKYKK